MIYKLLPVFKDYLWGGQRLNLDFKKQSPYPITAESWELSTHPDGISKLDNEERNFAQYLEEHDFQPLGMIQDKSRFHEMPIMIKLIDAKSDLSIQVHPDDAYAHKHEHQNGKNEMWYVVDCEPGAYVYYGLNQTLTRTELQSAIKNNRVLDYLNKVPVFPGDVIDVPAGTIHAIGAGVMVCEIQQCSNVTYRMYDFNRKDVTGATRELHIDQSLEVANLNKVVPDFKPLGEGFLSLGGKSEKLVYNDYFKVDKINLLHEWVHTVEESSFHAIVCLEGSMRISNQEHNVELNKGDTAFIDAFDGKLTVQGEGTYLFVGV